MVGNIVLIILADGDGGEDLEYGDVQISPLAYQDDIMKGNKDVVGA